MIDVEIEKVEIREDGRLFVKPASRDFAHIYRDFEQIYRDFEQIYRAAVEVYWDRSSQSLYSPKPREWTYPMWFGQIYGAMYTEYDTRLLLTSETVWLNISSDLQSQISDPDGWKG